MYFMTKSIKNNQKVNIFQNLEKFPPTLGMIKKREKSFDLIFIALLLHTHNTHNTHTHTHTHAHTHTHTHTHAHTHTLAE